VTLCDVEDSKAARIIEKIPIASSFTHYRDGSSSVPLGRKEYELTKKEALGGSCSNVSAFLAHHVTQLCPAVPTIAAEGFTRLF
jgi:hypothetical protein